MRFKFAIGFVDISYDLKQSKIEKLKWNYYYLLHISDRTRSGEFTFEYIWHLGHETFGAKTASELPTIGTSLLQMAAELSIYIRCYLWNFDPSILFSHIVHL